MKDFNFQAISMPDFYGRQQDIQRNMSDSLQQAMNGVTGIATSAAKAYDNKKAFDAELARQHEAKLRQMKQDARDAELDRQNKIRFENEQKDRLAQQQKEAKLNAYKDKFREWAKTQDIDDNFIEFGMQNSDNPEEWAIRAIAVKQYYAGLEAQKAEKEAAKARSEQERKPQQIKQGLLAEGVNTADPQDVEIKDRKTNKENRKQAEEQMPRIQQAIADLNAVPEQYRTPEWTASMQEMLKYQRMLEGYLNWKAPAPKPTLQDELNGVR